MPVFCPTEQPIFEAADSLIEKRNDSNPPLLCMGLFSNFYGQR